MTKKENIENPHSCLNKAADDEILFILRSKDPEMPATIRAWVNLRVNHGLNVKSDGKILGALRIAEQVDAMHKGKGRPSILVSGNLPPDHPSGAKARMTLGDRVTARDATDQGGRVAGFYTRSKLDTRAYHIVAVFWNNSSASSSSNGGLHGLRFYMADAFFFRPYNATTPWWVSGDGTSSLDDFGGPGVTIEKAATE